MCIWGSFVRNNFVILLVKLWQYIVQEHFVVRKVSFRGNTPLGYGVPENPVSGNWRDGSDYFV